MVKKILLLCCLLGLTMVLTATQGNVLGVPNSTNTVNINTSSAATTQLIALSSGQSVYVTAWDVYASGTSTVSLVYGTGTNCGTGTTTIAGPYSFIAQTGIARGTGFGAVLVVPSGQALCINNGSAVQVGGSISYQYGAP